MKHKAFTLVEIMIAVVLCSLILGVVYKVFSGTFNQFFKTSNKMTNLRSASIILERLKSDVRCAVVPVNEDEEPIIENGVFSFYTTSDAGKRKKVIYKYSGTELTREFDGSTRNVNKALVRNFTVVPSEEAKGNKYITVTIAVDNEQKFDKRSTSSKANEIELQAVLYPRFYKESMTSEEKYWYKTHEI